VANTAAEKSAGEQPMVLLIVIFSGDGITHDVPQIRTGTDQVICTSYTRKYGLNLSSTAEPAGINTHRWNLTLRRDSGNGIPDRPPAFTPALSGRVTVSPDPGWSLLFPASPLFVHSGFFPGSQPGIRQLAFSQVSGEILKLYIVSVHDLVVVCIST
jgi:hypothetical protein